MSEIIFSLERAIPVAALQRLLDQTSWAQNRSAEQLETMLKHSLRVGAWNGNELIGFARALIDDVVVDAAWRGKGIGAGLAQTLARRLDGVEEVMLFCDEDVVPFYERFGLARNSGSVAMIISRGNSAQIE
jgi:GNAT superfamily N-acetyltransferase